MYFKDICMQIACNAGEDITNLVVIERVKYKEEVEVRLSLLQTLVSGGYEINFNRAQIDTLWETFLKKSLCSAEREHYLKWLADATKMAESGEESIRRFRYLFLLHGESGKYRGLVQRHAAGGIWGI